MERTTSALMGSMPTRSSRPDHRLAGADERVGRATGAEERRGHDRPEHEDDEDDAGRHRAEPVRQVDGGEDAVPGDRRMTTQPSASALTATRRRRRMSRRRSRARATSALPRMVSPTIPETVSPVGLPPGRDAPGEGQNRRADS